MKLYSEQRGEHLEIILNQIYQDTVTGNLLCKAIQCMEADLCIGYKLPDIPYDTYG